MNVILLVTVGILMKLVTNIHHGSGRELKRFSKSRIKSRSQSLGRHLLCMGSFSTAVSVTVCLQMCECYMAEACMSMVWHSASLV